MRDKSSHVRAASAATAGVLARDTGHPAVIGTLIELFEDSDWTVRSSALAALSSVASQGLDDECIEKLFCCLESPMWSARVLAAQALGASAPYGNATVARGLAAALLDDDWAVKKAAATSLGIVARIGDDEAVDALMPLLEAADWRVRKTALKAIGNVAEQGCHRAIRAILLRLEDTCVAAPKRLDQVLHPGI
jgi:HEAT repeat protein